MDYEVMQLDAHYNEDFISFQYEEHLDTQVKMKTILIPQKEHLGVHHLLPLVDLQKTVVKLGLRTDSPGNGDC